MHSYIKYGAVLGLVGSLTAGIIGLTTSANAAQISSHTPISDDAFNNKSDSTKVIILPGKGYYVGNSLTVESSVDPDDEYTISVNDPSTPQTTVGELREQFEADGSIDEDGKMSTPNSLISEIEQKAVDTANYDGLNQSGNKLTTRGVTPATNNYGVNPNELYISQYFNEGGWRFAGYNFFAAGNNGPYLYWEQWSPDSGRVGTPDDARRLYNTGALTGYELGTSRWMSGYSTYYSFNPNNARYRVSNPN
jgi:hypothetical protein